MPTGWEPFPECRELQLSLWLSKTSLVTKMPGSCNPHTFPLPGAQHSYPKCYSNLPAQQFQVTLLQETQRQSKGCLEIPGDNRLLAKSALFTVRAFLLSHVSSRATSPLLLVPSLLEGKRFCPWKGCVRTERGLSGKREVIKEKSKGFLRIKHLLWPQSSQQLSAQDGVGHPQRERERRGYSVTFSQ